MDFFKTKIIEFFGLPKTGKTTTVEALKHYLKAQGKSVEVVRERASLSPIKDKLHPSFNYWTTVSFVKEYIEANDKGIDILIADRGILDSYVWINMLSKRVKDQDYFDFFSRFAQQELILKNYLISFHYKASIEKIMNREEERQMRKTFGRIMNAEVLEEYSKSYVEVKPELAKFAPIVEIDTTDDPIQVVLDKVSEYVDNKIGNIKTQGSSAA